MKRRPGVFDGVRHWASKLLGDRLLMASLVGAIVLLPAPWQFPMIALSVALARLIYLVIWETEENPGPLRILGLSPYTWLAAIVAIFMMWAWQRFGN